MTNNLQTMKKKNRKKYGWVVNTNKRDEKGTHQGVGIYFTRPVKPRSVPKIPALMRAMGTPHITLEAFVKTSGMDSLNERKLRRGQGNR